MNQKSDLQPHSKQDDSNSQPSTLFSDLQAPPKKPLPRETNASEVYATDSERSLPNVDDDEEEVSLPIAAIGSDEEGSELRSLPPVESDSE